MIVLIVVVGLYLSFRTKFFQITGFPLICRRTFGEMFRRGGERAANEGTLPPFQVLSTVLAGTIGSGNIAGVAAAIAIGGPGAVFWMWVTALFGMLTKMVEVSLAVRYRVQGADGDFYGGPMYYMRRGLGPRWEILAKVYSIALLVLVVTDACFVQTNTMATAAQDVFGVPLLASGAICIAVSIAVIVGGTKRIGAFCGMIVPPMTILYLAGAAVVIIANYQNVPQAFAMIFKYAFQPAPAIGGFAGATISLAMARGGARGIFSNEAGEGTAATVHATAQTDHPVHQGLYGVVEVFIDTIIVCTVTSLAILCSGVWSNGNTGVPLTFDAFRTTWGTIGLWIACVAVILFTYSSYLGFFVEFRTCLASLFGERWSHLLKWFFFVPPVFAVTMEIEAVWTLADIAVGFIFVPNIVAIVALTPRFMELFREYLK